jgi:hypothetical protein
MNDATVTAATCRAHLDEHTATLTDSGARGRTLRDRAGARGAGPAAPDAGRLAGRDDPARTPAHRPVRRGSLSGSADRVVGQPVGRGAARRGRAWRGGLERPTVGEPGRSSRQRGPAWTAASTRPSRRPSFETRMWSRP